MPAKKALPRKLDVVGRIYKVRTESRGVRNEELDERPYAGRTDHRKAVLTVDTRRSNEGIRGTLIHEALHAIDARTADNASQLAERDIDRLAVGIDYLLDRNPQLVALYTKARRKK